MVGKHECSLAVVDRDRRFLGLIPPYRMVRVLLDEHDEDLARLGGFLAGTARARGAVQESIARRLWHRLPWLLVGLLGAMGATAIVGAFEQQLDENVLLAFFIPAIVYMADAVGTQTETVLIRALSADVTVGSMLRRELITGLLMGLVIGGAFLVFALVGWGEADVAVAVALAMFASCSLATVVAMALPAAFQLLGRDPAFGSGPLATVLQDLLSIAVYLGIVSAFVL
jgi:magnesium transporter